MFLVETEVPEHRSRLESIDSHSSCCRISPESLFYSVCLGRKKKPAGEYLSPPIKFPSPKPQNYKLNWRGDEVQVEWFRETQVRGDERKSSRSSDVSWWAGKEHWERSWVMKVTRCRCEAQEHRRGTEQRRHRRAWHCESLCILTRNSENGTSFIPNSHLKSLILHYAPPAGTFPQRRCEPRGEKK